MVGRQVQSQTCPLLLLPFEIRRMILGEIFEPFNVVEITPDTSLAAVEDDENTTSWPSDQESFAITRHNLHSQLLITCRQLYTECLPFLYSQRTFNLTARESVKLLLHNIHPTTFSHIRHIILDWDALQDFAWSLSKPEYSLALSGLVSIEMATWRNRHLDTTSTRWRNVKGYERMICQAAADILVKHDTLCVLVQEEFVRKDSQGFMMGYSLDENDQLRERIVLSPRRVRWRLLSSDTDVHEHESLIDIHKDLELLKATEDEARDGGFHLPMIDPF